MDRLSHFIKILVLLIAYHLIAVPILSQNPIMKIAILNIEIQEGLSAAERERALSSVQYWQRHLHTLKQSAEVIRYPNTDRALDRFDLLIIPGTTSLSEQQTEVITRFIERGNRVILNEAAGKEVTGSPFNRSTLANRLGLTYKQIPADKSLTWRVVLNTPQYLTSGIPRMQILDVDAKYSYSATTSLSSTAFWIDPSNREDDFSYWLDTIAIANGTYGDGRFIWLGFNPISVGGDLANSEALFKLYQNILSWLNNDPVVEVNAWPLHYKAALTFSMDTETAFSNLNRMLEVQELPSFTLFILTDAAGMYHNLLRELATDERCELAVHGDSHEVFLSQPFEKQLKRLKGIREFFAEEIGVEVRGFRPPEEAYDFYTLQALQESGFDYIFADNQSDRAEPKIVRLSGRELTSFSRIERPNLQRQKNASRDIVQFPMLNKDDIKLIMIPELSDSREIYENYLQDIESILRMEGLYMANFHTHVLANRDNLPVLRDIALHLTELDIWMPQISVVSDWWLLRHNIAVTLTKVNTNSKTSVIVLTNSNDEPVYDASLSFWLENRPSSVSIRNKQSGNAITNYRIDDNRVRILLPEISPNSMSEYELRWQD